MLLGLSCTPLALRHPKSTSFGDGRSHPAFISVGRPSFGVWLKPPSNPPQHHPAPAPCTGSPQFDLSGYWAAGPRLVLLPAGFGWCLERRSAGMSPCPRTGHPTPELKQNLPPPSSTSAGWEETEPCRNLTFFSHGRGKKNETQQQNYYFFSSPSLTLLIWGFCSKVLFSPPCLELPLGTSRLQTCLSRETCFSIEPSFAWKSFNIKSVWLVMNITNIPISPPPPRQ